MKKGFTLLELLVVIAIIGVLSAVVLSALNSSRSKGADAAIKNQLASTRAVAGLFASNSTAASFDGVCALSGANTIGAMVNAAERAYGITPSTYADGTMSTWNTGQCHDSSNAWVAVVPLKASTSITPISWCVDSTGASKQVSTIIANGFQCI
ncbi:MAG: hypothetical protein QG585_89 [Patescibacteria group bacterium]|jgi:prepilin-type N-terminal cleavage/methylation domain-containing protein|nr:hypothetical protein [Patescibacteria group bacterium]